MGEGGGYNFSLEFSEYFVSFLVLDIKAVQGNFAIQRCRPKTIMLTRAFAKQFSGTLSFLIFFGFFLEVSLPEDLLCDVVASLVLLL